MDNVILQAIEKLNSEVKSEKNNKNISLIAEYLIQQCNDNQELAAKVLLDGKTLKGCLNHVIGQAKNVKHGNVAVVDSETVFSWATKYYISNLKEKGKVGKVDKTESNTNKTEQIEDPKPVKSKKKSKEMEGQLDLFSMMGVLNEKK